MARDEHTTNRPTPGGSAFQETGMDDYLTRVAEAVRDACSGIRGFLPKNKQGLVDNMIDGLNLETIIASVPRPEPVAAQVAVPGGLLTAADMKALRRFIECAEDWDTDEHDVPKEAMKRLERLGAVRSLGFGRHETTAFGDAMLAAAPEAPQTAVQDRRGVACLTAMDHISTETLESFNRVGIKFDATRGYAEELEAEIATLREQNAALVAALKAIDDLTGRAGFEFGGPLAVAMKEGLGDRDELLELAGIAGGHFEAISKHTENALASVKGDK